MPTFTPQDFDRVRAAARDAVEAYHLPGMSVGIVAGERLVFAEGFGFADIESKRPQDPALRQRIASITKTMAGLCVLALVDEGRLSLDSRVTSLLPDVAFEGPAAAMTVRHLLTHTSGIGEAATIEGLRSVATQDRASVAHPGEFTGLYPNGVVVETNPGAKWAYCNNGFALLGEIIERTEGADLQTVMERRIFGPLGMKDTDIRDEPGPNMTSCYHRAPNDDTRFQLDRAGVPVKDEPTVDGYNVRGVFAPDFNRAMRAAGGVQSNVHDMAKYAAALLANGGGMVRPETFAAAIAPQFAPDERLVSWGLAFGRTPQFGRTLIGHGGAYFGGWNSHLDVVPGEGIGVIQHLNVMMDEPGGVYRRIIRAVFDAPLERADPRPADASIRATAPGDYLLTMPGPLTNFRPASRVGRVNIALDGERLVLKSRWGKWKNGAIMAPWDADDPELFAIAPENGDPTYVTVARDAAGAVTRLRMDDLVLYEKVS